MFADWFVMYGGFGLGFWFVAAAVSWLGAFSKGLV